ncbi:Eukaryotic aspartyl protease family protein [Striga hermonthica]|uniref:Eukaryotic aspartyl protease family protein n=1 Tax=Striga hermonthica TaxID=68872 RepID=A0A9N7R7Y9_STRHE|nr:Eukaryotic aspartyl protease family protein [Striga hermonthica]
MKFVLYSILFLLSNKKASGNQFPTIGLTSHLPASLGKSNTPLAGWKRRRVDACAQYKKAAAAACFPVRSSLPVVGGEYAFAVTVGLGTPPTTKSLILDSTTDIMWTQCMPCLVNFRPQREPIFDPHKSSSYSALPCKSPQCSLLDDETQFGPSCSPQRKCVYYAADSYYTGSIGFLSMDKLSLHPVNTNSKSSTTADMLFGCSQSSWGDVVGLEAGYMGLGKGNLSIVSQTAANGYFSYCLPSNTTSQGFLALGKGSCDDRYNTNTTKFTPLIASPESDTYSSSYFIDTISIAVDGRNLEISPAVFSGGTLIDTVSTFGLLPPQAYAPLSHEFKKQMINHYRFTSAPPHTTKHNYTLDTCFFTPKPNTTKPTSVPVVTFTFRDNVEVDLDAAGTLFVVNESIVCLAFMGDTNNPPVVFANTQQKTYEVVFDVAGNRVRFVPNRCP